MREVYCVGYTPRARDTHSLQPILDALLHFEAKWLNERSVAIDQPLWVDHQNNFKIKYIFQLIFSIVYYLKSCKCFYMFFCATR